MFLEMIMIRLMGLVCVIIFMLSIWLRYSLYLRFSLFYCRLKPKSIQIKGHLAALKRLLKPGFEVYNLGTGTPTTVLELVSAFKSASGVDVPYQFVDRRPGDVAWLWCSPVKAKAKE